MRKRRISDVFMRLRQGDRLTDDEIDGLEEMLRVDPVTGLKNRRSFDEDIAREYARAERDAKGLAVYLIDVNDFKRVNDTFGHGAGDDVLRGIGNILGGCIRECDAVYRYAGDEFAALLVSLESWRAYDDAKAVAARMVENVRNGVYLRHHDGRDDPVSVSVGVEVCLPVDGKISIDESVKRADRAMYMAKGRKRSGGPLFEVLCDMNRRNTLQGTPAVSNTIGGSTCEYRQAPSATKKYR